MSRKEATQSIRQRSRRLPQVTFGKTRCVYGDKEGTGHYYTGGIAHDLTDSLTVYAEGEMADLDSGVETTSWSVGSKFTF